MLPSALQLRATLPCPSQVHIPYHRTLVTTHATLLCPSQLHVPSHIASQVSAICTALLCSSCRLALCWCGFLLSSFFSLPLLPPSPPSLTTDMQQSSPSRAYHSPTTNWNDNSMMVMMCSNNDVMTVTAMTTTTMTVTMAITTTVTATVAPCSAMTVTATPQCSDSPHDHNTMAQWP